MIIWVKVHSKIAVRQSLRGGVEEVDHLMRSNRPLRSMWPVAGALRGSSRAQSGATGTTSSPQPPVRCAGSLCTTPAASARPREAAARCGSTSRRTPRPRRPRRDAARPGRSAGAPSGARGAPGTHGRVPVIRRADAGGDRGRAGSRRLDLTPGLDQPRAWLYREPAGGRVPGLAAPEGPLGAGGNRSIWHYPDTTTPPFPGTPTPRQSVSDGGA